MPNFSFEVAEIFFKNLIFMSFRLETNTSNSSRKRSDTFEAALRNLGYENELVPGSRRSSEAVNSSDFLQVEIFDPRNVQAATGYAGWFHGKETAPSIGRTSPFTAQMKKTSSLDECDGKAIATSPTNRKFMPGYGGYVSSGYYEESSPSRK